MFIKSLHMCLERKVSDLKLYFQSETRVLRDPSTREGFQLASYSIHCSKCEVFEFSMHASSLL